MFTGSTFFGLNLLTLAGLVLTALGLSFARMSPGRRGIAIAVMGVGTALVFAGFYFTAPPPP